MGRFGFLKEYIFEDPKDKDIWNNKNVFFRLSHNEILDYESKLGRKFPCELKDFFVEVGYGFLRCDVNDYINRIMSPGDIFNFVYGINEFSNDERRSHYKNQNELVFYEVSEDSCLTMDLSNENSNGECPVQYNGKKVADSLTDFIERMNDESDYYLKHF